MYYFSKNCIKLFFCNVLFVINKIGHIYFLKIINSFGVPLVNKDTCLYFWFIDDFLTFIRLL